MKRYILKRDLPTFKAGETFALLDSFETHGLYRESDGVMAYHQTTLYKFPNILMEWFEEIKKPAEPIFDDEKVSKAIRAWLSIQAQPIETVSILCSKDSDGFFSYHLYGYIANARIVDGKAVVNKNLLAINFDFRSDTFFEHERGRDYSIAELIGEEEE